MKSLYKLSLIFLFSFWFASFAQILQNRNVYSSNALNNSGKELKRSSISTPPSVLSNHCDTLMYTDGFNVTVNPLDFTSFSFDLTDNDSLTPNPALTGYSSNWMIFYEVLTPGDTNWFFGATSWFDTPGQADNWIHFGQITVPVTGATLEWNHSIADNNFRDGYSVIINTVGNTLSDFINSGTTLLTFADNDPLTDGDTLWAPQTLALDSATYGCQTVYIAIRHNAMDQFLLLIDEITVTDCDTIYNLTAGLTSDSTNISLGSGINFSDASTSSPATNSWAWDFGDGNTSTSQNPAHTYTSTGTYDVQLIVNNGGCSPDTILMTNYITVNDTTPLSCDTLMHMDGLNVTINPTDFSNFTFGLTDMDSNTVNPAYAAAGMNSGWMIYYETDTTVVPTDTNNFLMATSWFATADTADNWIHFGQVTVPVNGADFTWNHAMLDNSFRDGYEIVINTVGNTIADYQNSGTVIFSYADNDPATLNDTLWTAQSVAIDSATYGCQTVYLALHHNAIDMNLLTIDEMVVEACGVDYSLNAAASGTPVQIPMGSSVNFTDNSTSNVAITSWNWSFGDGNTSTTQNPSNTYSNPGFYDVTLIVDNGGCGPDTVIMSNYIEVTDTNSTTFCDTLMFTDSYLLYVNPTDSAAFTFNLTDVDTLTPNPALTGFTSDWMLFYEVPVPPDTNWFLGATSWFDTPGTADNWIHFGPITVPAEGADFTWNHSIADNDWRDGYEVLINTVGPTVADFTANGTQLLAYADNDPLTDGDTVWTPQSVFIDSTTYAGQQVYLAIHHTASDMFLLFIDELGVINCNADSSNLPCTMTVSASGTDESAPAAGDGTATAAQSGGTSPFTYVWSNGDSLSTITGLTSGVFSVTVTDANGCSDTSMVTINALGCNLTATGSSTDETLPNANDGTAMVTDSAGTGTSTYLWSTGDSIANISGLIPGTYTVTVTDSVGCVDVVTVVINAYNCTLVASATSTDETMPSANNGTATATATGGTSPYTYLWSNGDTLQSTDSLAPGSYTVVITDSIGCMDSTTVTINVFTCAMVASVTSTDETAPGANDGTATASGSGGISPYTYNWSNGGTTSTISGLTPGSYSVIVTDSIGCSDNVSVTINAFQCTLTASATSTDETAVGANDGTATAVGTGGTTPYTYSWSGGGTTSTISALSPGAYSVTITDAVGCSDVANVTVNAGCGISLTLSSQDESCEGCDDGTATVIATGGISPYSYDWVGVGSTQTITGLQPGSYVVIVTDAVGCSEIGSVYVDQGPVSNYSVLNGDASFRVYPNPASSYVDFVTNQMEIENSLISVYNISGVLVEQFIPQSDKVRVNLERYSSGMYFVQFNNGNTIQTKELIISK